MTKLKKKKKKKIYYRKDDLSKEDGLDGRRTGKQRNVWLNLNK